MNDLGGSRNGVETAKAIIEVYEKIINQAHQQGIKVFGATITPFKKSFYENPTRLEGRNYLNQWVRTTTMLDGVIDFDAAVRNPDDPEVMQERFLFENDWLHFNALGYETMGNAIPLELF